VTAAPFQSRQSAEEVLPLPPLAYQASALTAELPAVGLHGRTRTCATRLRKPTLCPLSYVELVPTAGVEPARRPGFEDRRSVQLSYAGNGVAGGTCTRHLGAGNAVFCSLNYGHMVTAGGVAPPTSTVSAWRSAVELRSAGALGRCCPSGLRSVGAALSC
jgi:hypothetical protein